MKLSDVTSTDSKPLRLSSVQQGDDEQPQAPSSTGSIVPFPFGKVASRTGENLKYLAAGIPVGLASTPGELENLGLAGLKKVGLINQEEQPIFPTTKQIEPLIPESLRPTSEIGKTSQKVGELAGGLLWPAGTAEKAAGAIKGGGAAVARGVETAGRVAGRLVPGAGTKAVSMIEQIAKPADQGMETVGTIIRDRLASVLESSRAARAGKAAATSKTYLTQPADIEADIVATYRRFLTEELAKTNHPLPRKIIEDSLNNVGAGGVVNPGMDVMEIERRNLAEIASGKAEGVKAVQVQEAKTLRDKLESIIDARTAELEKFKKGYEEDSRTINLFKTAFGKKATDQAGKYLSDVSKVPAVTLPREAFKSKESIKALEEMAGGDRKFVEETARTYYATKLNQTIGPYMKTNDLAGAANAARRWLIKEQSERGIKSLPDIDKEAEQFVDRLEKIAKTRKIAKRVGLGAALGLGLTQGYYSAKNLLGLH